MKIAVAGTGYVGLVTGTCFAEAGNGVTCFDINEDRVALLNDGQVPIYEPGLEELVRGNRQAGRLNFTTSCEAAVADVDLIFLAVGTPQADDGAADLSAIRAVVDTLSEYVTPESVVVTKSTVPVGTNRSILGRFRELLGDKAPCVASNPEFLREGSALKDFQQPDRVVVGVEDAGSAELLKKLYAPFLAQGAPFLSMGLESAEMTKYAANCFLATKISFINEMANVCDVVGADIDDVRQGMGHDHRIGFSFLFPGVGYGGSCFPKDVRALQHVAATKNYHTEILQCVDDVNTAQKSILFQKLSRHFEGQLSGRTIAVWGLAFKPETDDIRGAPAITIARALCEQGANVRAFDPQAMGPSKEALTGLDVDFVSEPYAASDAADALIVVTEWRQFKQPDFRRLSKQIKSKTIFDGRNIYNPERCADYGLQYVGIGRSSALYAS